MSDRSHRRVENVRLIRLPDGRLVTQSEAEAIQPKKVAAPNASSTTESKATKRAKKQSLKSKLNQLRDKQAATKKVLSQRSVKAAPKTAVKADKTKKVEISLTLPKLQRPKLTKKQIRIGLAVTILLIGTYGGYSVLQKRDKNTASTDVLSNATQKTPEIPKNQKPEFGALLPAGKTIEQLGGYAKVSPEGSAPAYAFVDKVNKINIKVTQQELPEVFKANPTAELEKTAKNFNATKQLQIDSTTAYIGKSEKGPQTVIFSKDGLLVFIAAESEIPDVAWVQYIAGLQK